MYIQSLKLTNFKNYASQSFEFAPRLNCITGPNGRGKTNALDAVYYLCLCKSHSGLSDRHLVRHGESFFRIEGLFEKDGTNSKVVAKFQLPTRKEMETNGVLYDRLSAHIGLFPAVMVAPGDISLVQDGSEERRRFLDTTLSQINPDYLRQLMVYTALLKNRNALLKKFAEERRFDSALLETIDMQMNLPAQRIFEQRAAFIAEFEPFFQKAYAAISGSKELPGIVYGSDLSERPLAEWMEANQEKDRVLQRTAAGVHRDDLTLLLDQYAAKKFGSQGQLKSFLLSLRLAQAAYMALQQSAEPILLLDDIFDKLDAGRVENLIYFLLHETSGQVFITDAQKTRLEPMLGEVRSFEF